MLDFGLILVLLFLFQANEAVAGVIDLGTVEIFPVFGAMQKGLIDQETGLVLLEAQVITSDFQRPVKNSPWRKVWPETSSTSGRSMCCRS